METFRAKAKHDEELSKEADVALREVAGARIRASYMRAERAARAGGIVVVGELILLSRRRVGPGNQLLFWRHQRITRLHPANHFRTELASLLDISSGLLMEELPKLSDILFQLAHNKIGAVAAEVFFRWGIVCSK